MLKQTILVVFAAVCLGTSTFAGRNDEVTLFDATGKPVAYVADGLTIYLWSGKPVAYLWEDRRGGFHIYGFNGKHLGWFVKGVVRDHSGDAAGGLKETFRSTTQLEPLKGLKELKPLKNLRELPPLRPLFSLQWSDTPLKFLLLAGVE